MIYLKKSIIKQYRFDYETAMALRDCAASDKMTESAYIRYLIKADYYRRLSLPPERLEELYKELHHIGEQINLFALRINAEDYSYMQLDLLYMQLEKLKSIRQEISELNIRK